MPLLDEYLHLSLFPMDCSPDDVRLIMAARWFEIKAPGYYNLILVYKSDLPESLAKKLEPLTNAHWKNGMTHGLREVPAALKTCNNREGFHHEIE